MTKFTNIVPGRLWQVTDLLPQNQVEEILATDWLNVPWTKASKQETWLRREILQDSTIIQPLNGYICEMLPAINSALGTSFERMAGKFWVDNAGFTVGMHTDGHLPTAMQMYWNMPNHSQDYGTGFYHYKKQNSLLYQFLSRPNTGYIMLNHLNEDGSQPLQWHGMFNPVPNKTIRVTSDWLFS